MKNKILNYIAVLGFVFLYLPMIILVIYSFNSSKLLNIWQSFSFKWYNEIIRDQELLYALLQSLKFASISSTIGIILGCAAGISLTKYKIIAKKTYYFLVILPIFMPEIIIGVSLLILFQFITQIFSITHNDCYIIIAYSTVSMSLSGFMIHQRLYGSIDIKILEEAAQDLGANSYIIFKKITYPIIKTTIITSWMISFLVNFDDLIIANFIAAPGTTTLPMLIYSRLKFGLNPEINVLGTIFLFLGAISILVMFITRQNPIKNRNYR